MRWGAPSNFEYGTISDDERLSISEIIFVLGNPIPYPGSFSEGKVQFRCKNITDFSFLSDPRTCSQYVNDRRRSLDYCYAGQMGYNEKSSKAASILHPMLPTIQAANINIGPSLYGGPLYKLNGDIIGIIIRGGGSDISVHISAVKAFKAETDIKVAEGRRYPHSPTFDGSEWL